METATKETAQRITCVGSFELPCGADTAFPLFSPDGEKDWIKGWNPRPVFPETVEFRRDTVFREGKGEEEAVWIIVDIDWQEHRAEYVRVAPASHAAHIVVKIEPLGRESSRIAVSYTITVFGPHGEHLIDAFSEASYAAKMVNWQRQIGEYLLARKAH